MDLQTALSEINKARREQADHDYICKVEELMSCIAHKSEELKRLKKELLELKPESLELPEVAS